MTKTLYLRYILIFLHRFHLPSEHVQRKRLQRFRSRSPRLEDVAARAGVSTATVSRVLNRRGSVTPDLKARVETAIRELAYVPHGAARALASQRTRTIGAIVPTIDNAIFATALQQLQKRLSAVGYTLLLASSEYDLGRERDECHALVEKGVDGIILVGTAHDDAVYRLLGATGVPYLTIWSYDESSPHPNIGFDNFGAAARIVDYILDIGHTRVAMVAGINSGNDRARLRSEGVQHALRQRRLGFADGEYIEVEYTFEAGRTAAGVLLDRASPPTAVVCGNDVLALGVLFEALDRGLSVPRDLSITGFDGQALAGHVKPALTTVHIPSAEMGAMAADYIIARLDGRPTAARTCLDTSLVIRDTTAPPGSSRPGGRGRRD